MQNRYDTSHSTLYDFVIRNFISESTHLDAEEVTGIQLQDTAMYIQVDTVQLSFERTLNLSDIRDISIATCLMRIDIVNGTRLFFDSVVCRLNNLIPITIYSFDSLSTDSIFYRFYDLYLDSVASINISIFSPGTGNDSILASTQDSVDVIINFDSLRIYTGSFRSVPPRTARRVKDKIYSLPSNYAVRISDLNFRAGNLQVHLNNNFPFFCSLQVAIPELNFDSTLVLPAFNSASCELNLAERNYQNSSDSLTPLTFHSIYSFLIDSTFTSVDSHNFIDIYTHLTDVEIESIAGTIIDSIKQEFTGDTIRLNLPELLNQVETVDAIAILEITNAVAFPITLHLQLLGRNTAGDSAFIDTLIDIIPGTPTLPVVTSLVVDFDCLFNIHPNLIIIKGGIIAAGTGWINRAAFSRASYLLTTPLRVILHADTITLKPETINISRDTRDKIRDYADSADFYAALENHIAVPITGRITLQNLYYPPYHNVDIDIRIPSGLLNNFGVVTLASDTNVIYTLDTSAIKILTDSLVQVTLQLFIPQTDTISITARDYFKLKNSYVTIPVQLPPE